MGHSIHQYFYCWTWIPNCTWDPLRGLKFTSEKVSHSRWNSLSKSVLTISCTKGDRNSPVNNREGWNQLIILAIEESKEESCSNGHCVRGAESESTRAQSRENTTCDQQHCCTTNWKYKSDEYSWAAYSRAVCTHQWWSNIDQRDPLTAIELLVQFLSPLTKDSQYWFT